MSPAAAPAAPAPPAITAAQMVKRMARGINLGQRFEANQNSKEPAEVHKVLDAFQDRGFKHVRIPVTWWGDSSSKNKLQDASFMRKLTDAVEYAVSKGLIVVLNAHHERWLYKEYAATPAQDALFAGLWRDVASAFAHVPQNKLVLELLNEPQGCFGMWGPPVDVKNPEGLRKLRHLMSVGRDAIRAVDPQRMVAVATNGMGAAATAPIVYPTRAELPGGGEDRYLMVHVHSYAEWSNCGEDGSWDSYTCKGDPVQCLRDDIDGRFEKLKAWRDSIGGDSVAPVNLGEYGIGRKDQTRRDNDLTREYYRRTTKKAMANGISPTVWCDKGWFAIHDIKEDKVVFVLGIADAIFTK